MKVKKQEFYVVEVKDIKDVLIQFYQLPTSISIEFGYENDYPIYIKVINEPKGNKHPDFSGCKPHEIEIFTEDLNYLLNDYCSKGHIPLGDYLIFDD